MNPRNAINFFRSPVGAFVAFGLLVFVGITVANGFKKPTGEKSPSLISSANASEGKPQLVETVHKEMQPFNPPVAKDEPKNSEAAPQKPEKPQLPPISLFADSPSQ